MSNYDAVQQEVFSYLDAQDVAESLEHLPIEDQLSAVEGVRANRLGVISNALVGRINAGVAELVSEREEIMVRRRAIDDELDANTQKKHYNQYQATRARGLKNKTKPGPFSTFSEYASKEFAPVTILVSGFNRGKRMSDEERTRYYNLEAELKRLITPNGRSNNNLLAAKVMRLLRLGHKLNGFAHDHEVELHFDAEGNTKAISFPSGKFDIINLLDTPMVGEQTVRALIEFLQRHTDSSS